MGSLILTNSDFRTFLSDLNVTAKEVFKDTAFSVSRVADEAGKKLDPSEAEKKQVQQVGQDGGAAPSTEDLQGDIQDVTKVVANGTATSWSILCRPPPLLAPRSCAAPRTR